MVRNIDVHDDNHSAMCDDVRAFSATVGSSHDTISSVLQVQSDEIDVCNPCYLYTCITGDGSVTWLILASEIGVFLPLVSLGSFIQDLVIDCSLAYTVTLQR